MSSGNSIIDADFAAAWRLAIVEGYVEIAAAALLLYDSAISFGEDVDLVWRRKRSATTFLFITNRILGVMYALGLILFIPSWPRLPGCIGSTVYLFVPELLLFFVWATFSALRVYAIGGMAWRPATVVFLLALVQFGSNLYDFSSYRFSESLIAGLVCTASTPHVTDEVSNIMAIVVRVSLITSDTIVLVITWRNTYNIRKEAVAMNIKTSLASLLLRDGTLFFVTGLALCVIEIGTFLGFRQNIDDGVSISYLYTSASSMIISRFVLSLRQLSERKLNDTATGIVSDMGGEVDFAQFSDEYGEEDCEVMGELESAECDITESSVEPHSRIVEETLEV